MKDQSIHPTTLKTLNNIDVMVERNDFHDPTNNNSCDKLDWIPSSPTSCHDSVDDLNDNDSDASPVSVDSNVVINTFNAPQHSDNDSDGDCDSLDIQDLNQPEDEFDLLWTLSSPKFVSNDVRRVISQIPLKNKVPVLDDDNKDDGMRLVSYPPKKRQKTALLMLSHSKKPFGAFNSINDNDPKATRRNFTKIAFNETVDVLSIPMRYEYSPETRARLWSSINEINENAARNTIEFASDGWDWRNVTLDNDMFHCPTTGQVIHPVHRYNQHPQPNGTITISNPNCHHQTSEETTSSQ